MAKRRNDTRKIRLGAEIATIIQQRREALGISQEQLAERAAVDRAYISEIERGLRNFSFAVIENIADGLNIPLSLLVYLAEYEREQREIDSKSTERNRRMRELTKVRKG